jgi:hypothetical protein
MSSKVKVIKVQDTEITIVSANENDYICITDIAKTKDGESRAADIIKNWIRNRSTLEFIGTWEQMYNPHFKVVEFDHFKMQAGLPSFVLSPGLWAEKTNAIGIYVKLGKYGGTYAHKDIAFEFCSAISPVFKLYLIKEYQRLKEDETDRLKLEWNVKRLLSKTNYHLQTDAVQKHILPKKNYSKNNEWLVYAEEADLLNVALFDCTAKDWREANPELAAKNLNIRDMASINELTVLSNIESMNSVLILQEIDKPSRFNQLCQIAKYQLNVLNTKETYKSIRKSDNNTLSITGNPVK